MLSSPRDIPAQLVSMTTISHTVCAICPPHPHPLSVSPNVWRVRYLILPHLSSSDQVSLLVPILLVLLLLTTDGLHGQPTEYPQVRLQMAVQKFEPVVGMAEADILAMATEQQQKEGQNGKPNRRMEMTNDAEILQLVNSKRARSSDPHGAYDTLESLIEWVNGYEPKHVEREYLNEVDRV